jgi:DNA helicase-2/ATP-dependent DNA helicase PcrA
MYNHKQLKAITCNDRFIFVNAGAGSGKTTVMIERMKRLIHEGISEEDILGLTFSKEAATQMKERLNIENVFISTFHSFCYQHLEGFDVIPKSVPFSKEFLLKVSLYKNKMGRKPFFYQRYISYLKKHKFIDYDDMLIRFISIKDVSAYKHILIDEFQDTNFLQISVLLKLIHDDTHVFVVGDPDQSIYRFRGAMKEVSDYFIHKFHATIITLDMNYRSDRNILSVANRVIRNNSHRIEKSLICTTENKGIVAIHIFDSIDTYLQFMYNIIITTQFNSYAIITRTNKQLFDVKTSIHQMIPTFKIQKISLFTMHASKGLEFDCVFILGVDNHHIPYKFSRSMFSIEEERRLLYVGITRARHALYFIHYKYNKNVKLSKFIDEISDNQVFKAIK